VFAHATSPAAGAAAGGALSAPRLRLALHTAAGGASSMSRLRLALRAAAGGASSMSRLRETPAFARLGRGLDRCISVFVGID